MSQKQKVNKKAFKVEDKDYAVLRPGNRLQQQAQLVYGKAHIEAVQAGVAVQEVVFRDVVEKVWDKSRQDRFVELVEALKQAELKLAKGAGSGLSKQQARDLAVQMRRDRIEIRLLTAERNKYLQNTAEAYAEQAKFNFFVAACTVYEDTGERVWKDVEDYLSRDSEDPVVQKATLLMTTLAYGLDDEFEKHLPENAFLRRYSYCNDELHLTDSRTGHLVNAEGKPVNDRGDLVNDKDEPIDADGNLLTETGEYKVDFQEWADEPAPAEAAA